MASTWPPLSCRGVSAISRLIPTCRFTPPGTSAGAITTASGSGNDQIKKIRLVGFFQNCGEGLPYYARSPPALRDAQVASQGRDRLRAPRCARDGMGQRPLPHRADVRRTAHPKIATELSVEDGINAVRAILPLCHFDAEACSEGIQC